MQTQYNPFFPFCIEACGKNGNPTKAGVVYCTCDIGAVFMEASHFGDSVTRAFLLPYRQAPARAGEFFHEQSPPNLMLRRCSLFIANSGPAALVCKRTISAHTVCVQIPGPPTISAVSFEEQRLFLQVKPARTSRQAKPTRTPQGSVEKSPRFALHCRACAGCFHVETAFYL